MAAVTGMAGSVSWANGSTGSNNAQFTSNSTTGGVPIRFTLNLNGDEFDTTAFATTDPASDFLKGLSSWDGEFEILTPTAEIGNQGLVTFSAGYTTNLASWDLSVERDVHEATAFGSTAKAYIPGRYVWGGTFRGFLDDTTAAAAVGNSSEPATLTLKYSERTTTDATFSGSAFTTRADIVASPAEINTIGYSFRGSGALTHSTPSTGNNFISTGALTGDSAGTLTLTSTTSRTYSGSAFWKSINMSVTATGLIVVRIGFQGTGALTIS